MDDQVLTFYGKGLPTLEIVQTFKEMCDAGVSAILISRMTDQVLEQILPSGNRFRSIRFSTIVYLDCIVHMLRNSLK